MDSDKLDLTRKDLVWYRDVVSGMIFVGEGAFLDVRTPEEIFHKYTVNKVEIIQPVKLPVQDSIWISWLYCDHTHRFYTTSLGSAGVRVLHELFDEDQVTIEISKGFLDSLIKLQRQADEMFLTGPTPWASVK